jgi:hypothetical protein
MSPFKSGCASLRYSQIFREGDVRPLGIRRPEQIFARAKRWRAPPTVARQRHALARANRVIGLIAEGGLTENCAAALRIEIHP